MLRPLQWYIIKQLWIPQIIKSELIIGSINLYKNTFCGAHQKNVMVK
jgi:hypothetical protein